MNQLISNNYPTDAEQGIRLGNHDRPIQIWEWFVSQFTRALKRMVRRREAQVHTELRSRARSKDVEERIEAARSRFLVFPGGSAGYTQGWDL